MAAGDLTTVQKVKDYLGSDSVDSDGILAQFVTSSSMWVVSQLGGAIASASYTEVRDGDGSDRLLLNHYPPPPDARPVTITSVTVDGSAIAARASVSSSNLDPTGYVLIDGGITLRGYAFNVGVQNVTVVYTVGYSAGAIPADLEQAVIEHVALRYRDRKRIGLASSSIPGETVSYSEAAALAYINGVLDTYRPLAFS